MPTLGDLLRQCRKDSKLKKLVLEDLAQACDKDIGYLSKVENNKIEKNKIAAAFSRNQILKLAQLFRDNLVSESLIEEFVKAFKTARITNGKFSDEESDIAQMIYDTLQELDESEKRGYIKELDDRNYVWHGIHLALVGFNPEGKVFKKPFQDINEALQRLDKMEKESVNNFRARNQLGSGRMLRYLAQVGAAETKLSNAVELARESGDETLFAETLKERGDFYRRSKQQNLDLALQDYRNAFNIFEKWKDGDGKAILQLRIASILLTAGQPQKARPICDEVFKYAEMGRNEYLERKSLEYKAWAHSMLGDIDRALELQSQAHKITVKTKQPAEIAKSLTYLAGYYLLCGLLDDAENSYNNADGNIDELLKDMGDSGEAQELFIRCSIKLGLGAVKIRRPDGRILAKQYLDKSFDIADQLNDQLNKGRALMLLGELDLIEGDRENAQIHFKGARSLFESTGLPTNDTDRNSNPYYLSSLELNCAAFEYEVENFTESILHLEQAKKLSLEFGFQENLFKSQLWEARISIAKDKNPDPEQIAKLCISVLEGAIPIGLYISREVLAIITSILDFAYQKNHRLAIRIDKALLNRQPEMLSSAVSFDEKQRRVLENWFKRLNTSNSEWEAMDTVLKVKMKTNK